MLLRLLHTDAFAFLSSQCESHNAPFNACYLGWKVSSLNALLSSIRALLEPSLTLSQLHILLHDRV